MLVPFSNFLLFVTGYPISKEEIIGYVNSDEIKRKFGLELHKVHGYSKKTCLWLYKSILPTWQIRNNGIPHGTDATEHSFTRLISCQYATSPRDLSRIHHSR